MNPKEIEIASWLILNKEGLTVPHNPAHEFLPDNLYFIYLENYENNVINVIKKEIAQSLQLNPEECLLINKNFVIMVLGSQFLIPPK